jgi:hypothetical protein
MDQNRQARMDAPPSATRTRLFAHQPIYGDLIDFRILWQVGSYLIS